MNYLVLFFSALDYCKDIYPSNMCAMDKYTMCHTFIDDWAHLCLKTCACEFNKHLLLIDSAINNLLI